MSDVNDQRRYYERMMDEVGAEYRRCIADLQDENEKLREQVASLTDRSIRIADKMDCLEAENRKLRELARDYEHCGMRADCDSCKYDGTTSTHCPFSPCFPDIDELRELGVEVDG